MSFTKKQKKYIKSNYPHCSILEISKSISVPQGSVEEYLRTLGLYKKAPKKDVVKKQFTVPYYVYPAVLLLLTLIAGIYCFDTKLYVSGDNVEFILLGKSMASGNGLGGAVKYPFGFPLLLAAAQILSNNSLIAQKILVFLLYIFGSVFVFLVLKRYVGEVWGFFLTLFSMLNPFVLEFSHYVMSEIPFLFFSFLGIYLFEKYKDEPLQGYRLYIAIAAVAFAYYVRSTGIALVGAAVFYYILKMEWKRLLAVGGSFFALLFPWYLRNANLEGGSSYLNQLILVNPYRPEMGTLGFDTLIGRIVYNFKVYFLQEIPHCIMPLNVRPTMFGPGEALPLFLSVILVSIFIAGFIWAFINRQYLLTVYGTFYLIIVMLWPQVWSGNRFILPITPLFVYFSAYLFYKLREVLRGKIPLVFRDGLVYILALFLLIISVKNIYAYGETVKNYPPGWANYFKAAEWARDNLPEDCIISDRKGGLFGTVSKRKCVGFLTSPDKKAVIDSLYSQKVDYIVIPLGIGYTRSIGYSLVPAVKEYMDKFKQVYFIDNPPTYILKFDRTKDLTE